MKLLVLISLLFFSIRAQENMAEFNNSTFKPDVDTYNSTYQITYLQEIINSTEETHTTLSIQLQDVHTNDKHHDELVEVCRDSAGKFNPVVTPWNRSHILVSWDDLLVKCSGFIDTV